ncbi:hypothetical protein [Litchfieldia alkalitelluris]|uniref:hypothetical protein n=1 Tax=Litchfieldia alkalitelluris TaxID=304268 RepID=UPI000997BABE|nr:hypothetical protein [Litchfieldia alkalitelluris]
MASKDLAIKSVAFNREDPDQLALLKHASKRSNFSSYIKRLIQRDLEGGGGLVFHAHQPMEPEVNNQFMSDLL